MGLPWKSSVLSIVLLMNFWEFTIGSNAFEKNSQDRRCRKRGQFLTHPSDTCKYMVCEFAIGSSGYGPGRLYATEMPCAPGTQVSESSLGSRNSLYGNPCTEISRRCGGSSTSKSGYGRRRSSSSYRPHRSRSNRGGSSRGGYSSSTESGRGYALAARRQQLVVTMAKPRRRTSYQPAPSYASSSHSSSSSSYEPAPAPSYGSSSSHSSSPSSSYGRTSSSSSSYGRRLSTRTLEQTHFQNHFQDERCNRLGEYLTHPTDRCKYIVCEFALGSMAGYGGNPGVMYAREMKCAPGTAVSNSMYSDTRRGWQKAPCTDHYEAYCPASVSRGGGGGYSSSFGSAIGAPFHPLNKPRGSDSSNQYTVYWV